MSAWLACATGRNAPLKVLLEDLGLEYSAVLPVPSSCAPDFWAVARGDFGSDDARRWLIDVGGTQTTRRPTSRSSTHPRPSAFAGHPAIRCFRSHFSAARPFSARIQCDRASRTLGTRSYPRDGFGPLSMADQPDVCRAMAGVGRAASNMAALANPRRRRVGRPGPTLDRRYRATPDATHPGGQPRPARRQLRARRLPRRSRTPIPRRGPAEGAPRCSRRGSSRHARGPTPGRCGHRSSARSTHPALSIRVSDRRLVCGLGCEDRRPRPRLAFPFHKEALVSASGQLAAGLVALGVHPNLAGSLTAWVHSQRREDGGWGDADGAPDLLTTLVAAELLAGLDPTYDPRPTTSWFASAQRPDGWWRACGPEATWLTVEILAWLQRADRPFAERFVWPHLAVTNRDRRTGYRSMATLPTSSGSSTPFQGLAPPRSMSHSSTWLGSASSTTSSAWNGRRGPSDIRASPRGTPARWRSGTVATSSSFSVHRPAVDCQSEWRRFGVVGSRVRGELRNRGRGAARPDRIHHRGADRSAERPRQADRQLR